MYINFCQKYNLWPIYLDLINRKELRPTDNASQMQLFISVSVKATVGSPPRGVPALRERG